MSWLKRLVVSTDAVEDARERAAHDSEPAPESSSDQSSALPGGWGKPDVSDEGEVIVIALQAPGLKADTVSVEPRGSSLQVRAEGERGPGEKIKLDEVCSTADDRVAFCLVQQVPVSSLVGGRQQFDDGDKAMLLAMQNVNSGFLDLFVINERDRDRFDCGSSCGASLWRRFGTSKFGCSDR